MSTPEPTKKTMSEKFRLFMEVVVHAALLVAPLCTASILHDSDSLIYQVPSDESLEAYPGLSDIGFGLRHFSSEGILNTTDYAEDVHFSDEQQEALGGSHEAAHILFHVLHGVMWLGLGVPIGAYLYRRWFKKESHTLNASKLSKTIGGYTIPLIILGTLLMLVPFYLLTQSNLCNSSYMELGFAPEEDASDSSDDGCDDSEWYGTYAKVLDDVPSTCELGNPSTVGFLVSRALVPILSLVQARLLFRRANQLETKYQLETVLARRDFSVEKEVEDDATVVTEA